MNGLQDIDVIFYFRQEKLEKRRVFLKEKEKSDFLKNNVTPLFE